MTLPIYSDGIYSNVLILNLFHSHTGLFENVSLSDDSQQFVIETSGQANRKRKATKSNCWVLPRAWTYQCNDVITNTEIGSVPFGFQKKYRGL